MKKVFTLISVAMLAMSMNAQDKYEAAPGAAAASEISGAKFSGTDLIANISTTNVTVKAVSSKTPLRTNTSGLTQNTWDKWSDAKWDVKSIKISDKYNFNYVQGGGVPYTSFKSKTVETDGTPTGDYDPEYTYYSPDGTAGFPVSGEYVEFTAKKAGMFKIGFWANKGGSRKLYIVKKSDKKALNYANGEYKVEGYINGWNDANGNKAFIESIPVVDYVIGATDIPNGTDDQGKARTFNQQGQPKFAWFVFDAKANETYQIFGSDWQFGFQGYEFTVGGTIKNYTPKDPVAGIFSVAANPTAELDAPVYNLAGQKVGEDYKGVVVKNGKKFVQK